MPAIPESTKTSLAQRLREHAKAKWPQLAAVDVRYRGQFAYVTGELTDGEQLPLMRLRYSGPPTAGAPRSTWPAATATRDQVWFSGSTEEAFDFVCDIHIGTITP